MVDLLPIQGIQIFSTVVRIGFVLIDILTSDLSLIIAAVIL